MNKKIYLIICLFLFGLTLFFYQQYTNRETLTFKINEKSNDNESIWVDNEKALVNDYIITPITMTTTRPVSIKIGKKLKKIKVKNLSKYHFITIKIVYKDKIINYFLQTLPSTFPQIYVNNKTNKKGYVLISFHGLMLRDPSYSVITDMNGKIIYYRGNTNLTRSMFHLQKVTLPNGKFRYITHAEAEENTIPYVEGYHIIMDENFNVLDKVKILKTKKHDEMLTDEHDILMLDDGHYIVIGYQEKDIILPNGRKSEIIHGIIQEQKNGKVLFDWTSEDFPQLYKANFEKRNDYMHLNSLAIDPKDNNIIGSSAAGYYVIKIHRKTGKILWILGGKFDQFNIEKRYQFTRQHNPYFLSNGNLVIFDNHMGYLTEEKKARILIFDLDEKNKKIIYAREIPLNFYAKFMGNAQELKNGQWFVGCGSSSECSAELIDKTGEVLWKIKAKEPYTIYRAYYYDSLK